MAVTSCTLNLFGYRWILNWPAKCTWKRAVRITGNADPQHAGPQRKEEESLKVGGDSARCPSSRPSNPMKKRPCHLKNGMHECCFKVMRKGGRSTARHAQVIIIIINGIRSTARCWKAIQEQVGLSTHRVQTSLNLCRARHSDGCKAHPSAAASAENRQGEARLT